GAALVVPPHGGRFGNLLLRVLGSLHRRHGYPGPPFLSVVSDAATPATACRGMVMRNVEPLPSSLVAVMLPPCDEATCRATPRPRPTPLFRFVERKSLTMRSASFSAGMPTPVSATSMTSDSPPSPSFTRIVTFPCGGRPF